MKGECRERGIHYLLSEKLTEQGETVDTWERKMNQIQIVKDSDGLVIRFFQICYSKLPIPILDTQSWGWYHFLAHGTQVINLSERRVMACILRERSTFPIMAKKHIVMIYNGATLHTSNKA